MAVMKMIMNVAEVVEKGKLDTLLVEETDAVTVETVRFLENKKMKIELFHMTYVPLLDIYMNKMKTQSQQMNPAFTAAYSQQTKTSKQPKCPSRMQIQKMIHTHTHTQWKKLL